MPDQPQRYLRRCNNRPPEGVVISRTDVEFRLSLALAAERQGVVVTGDLQGCLSIHIPAGRPWEVEAPGTEPRVFTYRPLPAGQHRIDDRRQNVGEELGEQ